LENKSERGRGRVMERLLETRSSLANVAPCGMLLEGRLKSDDMGNIWEWGGFGTSPSYTKYTLI